MYNSLTSEINKLKNSEKANLMQGFFKTGKGQYGYGDIFLGLTMPQMRIIAKKYKDIKLTDLQKIISSKYHEYRMISFVILTYKYEKASEKQKQQIFNFYIKNHQFANNWDLIDVTTPRVLGDFILNNSKHESLIYKYANSDNLWEKRISVLITFMYIKHNHFYHSLKIAKILLKDNHDLIHKAVGWMLREIGKKDQSVLESFLKKHYKNMPRTMLRYSIEKFPEELRKKYLHSQI